MQNGISSSSMVRILAVAIGSAVASSSYAQQSEAPRDNAVEEVIVTATRSGATRLQDTPMAITAIGGDLFQNAAGRDIRDLQMFSPSLTITQNGSSAQPYIRGIGSNSTFPGSDSSIGFYVDGVYIGRPSSFFQDMFDVDHVEVMRGPQGTLYGRNAIAGAISVVSRKPANQLEAVARVTAGDYGLIRTEGYLSGPIVADMVTASISGRYSKREGYFKNVVPGVGDADSEYDRSVRGQVRVTPTDKLEVLLRGDYLDSNSTVGSGTKTRTLTGYDPVVDGLLNQPRTLAFNTVPITHRRDEGVSGEINYTFSDAAKLTSLTAYRKSDGRTRSDSDFSAASIRYTDYQYSQEQFSQDLTLSGKVGALTYVAGLNHFDENISAAVAVTTFPSARTAFLPDVKERSEAGFAQGTFAVTPKLSLSAGLRYTWESKSFAQNQESQAVVAANYPAVADGPTTKPPVRYVARRADTAWTPKIGAEYRPMDDVLVYVSVAKGFKSGGYSLTSTNPAQGYSPEELWSYEAGLKTEFADHRGLFNLTVFRYDYSNLQVQSFLTPGVLDVTNAATARVNGVEAEARYTVVDGLTLGGSLTYLDAKYLNFPNAIGPGNVPYDASGNRLNAAPRISYNLNAAYERRISDSMTAFGRVDYMSKSRLYFTAKNVSLESQEQYGLVNAQLGVTLMDKRVQVSMFARNLANKTYFTTTATLGATTFGTLGAPRTFGVQVTGRY